MVNLASILNRNPKIIQNKLNKMLLYKNVNTVEPVLSGHPRGMVKWPLNTGCTKYRSDHGENAILYYVVNSLRIKALKNHLLGLK